jgi:hypothetical protein
MRHNLSRSLLPVRFLDQLDGFGKLEQWSQLFTAKK